MKLLLDTNIIIDATEERNDTHKAAQLLLMLGKLGEFKLCASPSQWTDVFYILTHGEQAHKQDKAKQILKDARESVSVSMMGEAEIDKALNSAWADFEDAVVYQAAVSSKADALITNNKKDFALSELPTFTCKEFFEWLETEKNIIYDEIEL